MKHTCAFQLVDTTKGALRYQQIAEVDEEGKELKIDPEGHRDDQGVIGTLYVRKNKMVGQPKTITVTVDY